MFSSLIVISSCTSLKKKPENLYDKVSIEINTEKGKFTSDGFIDLYIKVINNSKSEINVLKPSTRYGYKFNFFRAQSDCDGMSLMMESDPYPLVLRTDDDIVTIQPKSSVEFFIPGHLYELICDGSELTVSMTYDTDETSRYFQYVSSMFEEDQKAEQMKIYNSLTKLKVQSPTVKIGLN